MLTKSEAVAQLNLLGGSSTPFSFYCDFLGERWCIEKDNVEGSRSFELSLGPNPNTLGARELEFEKFPIALEDFCQAFDRVVSEINYGNSFLTNLTFQTPITTNLSLDEIYKLSQARYRLLVPDSFVAVSYTHLRAHETKANLVCRLLLEKKKKT